MSGTICNKKILKKNFKNEDENEEEKNEDLVENCYDYHFHWSDSLILERHQCEKIPQKY